MCSQSESMRCIAVAILLISPVVTFAQSAPASQSAAPREPASAEAVEQLQREARDLVPLAASELGKAFLRATADLPPVAPRTIYRHKTDRTYVGATEHAALPAEKQDDYAGVAIDERAYYLTKYGSPLAYLRPLEILAASGITGVSKKRVLDFGYGTVGHLRLLALCGADAAGVDVDTYLNALYSEPNDTGEVAGGTPAPPSRERGDKGTPRPPGRVTLVHGQWPATDDVRRAVGGGYDLILSKNTLKNGYIHPAEPVDPRKLVHLGVDEAAFVRAVFEALNPGGYFLIYNICPAPAKPGEAYIPWADGRSPFSREQFEQAGFRVLKLDQDDGPACRVMARALGWDQGARPMDLENDLFAHYTLVQKPGP